MLFSAVDAVYHKMQT